MWTKLFWRPDCKAASSREDRMLIAASTNTGQEAGRVSGARLRGDKGWCGARGLRGRRVHKWGGAGQHTRAYLVSLVSAARLGPQQHAQVHRRREGGHDGRENVVHHLADDAHGGGWWGWCCFPPHRRGGAGRPPRLQILGRRWYLLSFPPSL